MGTLNWSVELYDLPRPHIGHTVQHSSFLAEGMYSTTVLVGDIINSLTKVLFSYSYTIKKQVLCIACRMYLLSAKISQD